MGLATIFEHSQRLAITAAEEAQRFGHPAVDVEHVFLALLISETDAGRMLRGRGISLEGARRAVQAEHADRLGALGLTDVQVPPGAIPTGWSGDIDWNERAVGLFSHTVGDSTGTTLLRMLVADGGGFVSAVLERVGVDPSEVLAATGTPTSDSTRSRPRSERAAADQTAVYDAFVPAPAERVWALLDDPLRRPEWDETIARIKVVGTGQWLAQAPTTLSGTRWRVPRRARTRSIVLLSRQEHHSLEWETSFPRTRTGRTERLRAELGDQPGGTLLRLSLDRPHARSFRRVARPLAAGELTRIAAGISRVFRS